MGGCNREVSSSRKPGIPGTSSIPILQDITQQEGRGVCFSTTLIFFKIHYSVSVRVGLSTSTSLQQHGGLGAEHPSVYISLQGWESYRLFRSRQMFGAGLRFGKMSDTDHSALLLNNHGLLENMSKLFSCTPSSSMFPKLLEKKRPEVGPLFSHLWFVNRLHY